MSEFHEKVPGKAFDEWTYFASVFSLLITAFFAVVFIHLGGLGGGLYGGTIVILGLAIILQILILGGIVGLPALVLFFRKRFAISRFAVCFLVVALAGVAGEIVVLWLTPISGNC